MPPKTNVFSYCLLFFLPKAMLWALHSGWEAAEPISAGLAGVLLPEGGGKSSLGAEGRGAAGWPHTPHIVLRGWKSALLMLDHAVDQPKCLTDRGHLPSWGFIHAGKSLFLHASIIWIATVTRMVPKDIWGTDELIFKEHWKKRHNCGCLAINRKLNHPTCDAPYK